MNVDGIVTPTLLGSLLHPCGVPYKPGPWTLHIVSKLSYKWIFPLRNGNWDTRVGVKNITENKTKQNNKPRDLINMCSIVL